MGCLRRFWPILPAVLSAASAFAGDFTGSDVASGSYGSDNYNFYDTSSAGSATFNVGSADPDSPLYSINFNNNSSAASGTFNLARTTVDFNDSSSGGNANFTLYANAGVGFIFTSAGAATITAVDANTNVSFLGNSGGTATVNLLNAGAKLTVAGSAVSFGSLSGIGQFVTANTDMAVTVGTNNASTTFTGTYTGSGSHSSLTKVGTGTFTFDSTNSYAGGTTVAGGFLQIDSDARLGTGGLTLNGGGIKYGAAFNDLRAFTLGASGATLDTNGFDVTYGGSIASTAGSLTKAGAGTLALTGSNAYTGGTTITGGLLEFSSLANLGSGTVTLDGGGLRWASGTTTDVSSVLNPVIGAGGASFDTNGNNVTLSTALSGSGGVTKLGSGTLTFSGANSYTGDTAVDAGTLALGAQDILAHGSTVTVNGGTLSLGSTTQTAGTVSLQSGSLTGGTLYAGTYDVSSGTISTALAGSGTLVKSGSGTVVIDPALIGYTGATTVNGGTLALSRSSSVLSFPSPITVSNATVQVTGSNAGLYTNTITLLSGGVFFTSGSTVEFNKLFMQGGTLSGNSPTDQFYGNYYFPGGGNQGIYVSGDTPSTIDAATATLSGVITFEVDSGTAPSVLNVSTRLLANPSPVGISYVSKTGVGTLTLSGDNSYTGLTIISGGTLIASHADALGTTAGGTTVADGATLTLNGVAVGAEPLTLSGVGAAGNGALTGIGTASLGGTITLAADAAIGTDGTLTLAGGIGESGGSHSLTKLGTGTLTLSGSNSYSGLTTVSSGTLVANNAN
ncbi:MAG TPA: autotransporter-associated beta strand repeat-containing protein, partial [Opitutus sp.]|nr:autotransporter-associated beta strand repeat-containing protein [Opitutus sp.]